jgi:zinc protease
MKTLLLILISIFVVNQFSYSQDVIELKQPNSNKVVIKLMFRNGSICDPAGKEGLTRLTAGVLTSGGSSKYTYSQIQDLLYPMAAGYSASVDKEVTIITLQCPSDFINEFYAIIKDVILNPSFAEQDFERVKSNQQNFVDQVIRASSDEEYSKKSLEDFLFRGTRYQHMVEGKSESVKSITLEDVKAHYKNYFTKDNLLIGIAGNYTGEFLNTLKSDLQTLPAWSMATPVIPEKVVPKNPDGINVEIISKTGAFGSAIFMGFPMDITRSSDEFAALMIANSYLGEHRKSYGVLYNKLRETRSMNYGDYSYIEWYDNGGRYMLPPPGVPRNTNYFSMWIRPVQIAKQLKAQYSELSGVTIGHAHFSIRMAVRELDKLVTNGMSKKDFEITRQFLKSYIKLYTQTPSDQLGYLMDSKFYGRKDYLAEMDPLLAKLTVDDVNKAIKKYWQVNNMCITIVTDESEADALASSLLNNTESPMSYSNLVKSGQPKEILQEDEVVAKYKMNVKSVKIVKSEDTFK